MVQQGETNLSLVLALGTVGMLVLAVFIIVFIVFYQKKQISQQLSHQRALLSATIQTQENERKRIARDLHDSVGGVLSAAKLNINQALRTPDEESASQALDEAKKRIDETLVDTRRISHNLLPATLSEFGLVDTLEEHCNKLNSSELEVLFQHHGEKKRVEEKIELALFRIVQELLHNVIKHAAASIVEVKSEMDAGLLRLEVKDNGKGFDVGVGGKGIQDAGLGLKNIESRVSMINATINYFSVEGEGTKVVLELILAESK